MNFSRALSRRYESESAAVGWRAEWRLTGYSVMKRTLTSAPVTEPVEAPGLRAPVQDLVHGYSPGPDARHLLLKR